MVSLEIISKSIEDAMMLKCPTSSRARKRGTGGVQFGKSFDDAPFEQDDEWGVVYPDGTSIVFDPFGEVKNIHIDGEDYEYLGSRKAYATFKEQDDKLKEEKAKINNFHNYNMGGGIMDNYDFETEYDFVKFFADGFASSFGFDLNKKLYANEKLDKYKAEGGGFLTSPMVITDSDVHVEHFIELEKGNRIDTHGNIVLQNYTNGFHDNDGLDKLSYTDKGFTSTSAGGDNSQLKSTFGNKEGSWAVYTIVKEGSDVKGLFLGNAITDYRNNGFRTFTDWEAEVNLPPKTRFTRDLIDEERHIIIRHVEKQS